MEDLKYTNEFLKNLEAVLKKEPDVIKNIKNILEQIARNNSQSSVGTLPLQNTKTYSNQNIYITKVEEKGYNIFWTEENSQKIIVSLIKSQ